MGVQLVGNVKAELDSVIALIPNMTLADRKYFLEKISNKKLTDAECGTVGSPSLVGGLYGRKTRAEYLKDWGHLRKFEEQEGMTFSAWRRNIDPLINDASVTSDIKRELILANLGPTVYSRVVLRRQNQDTPEQLILDLEADYTEVVNIHTEMIIFFELTQEEDEDVLEYIQRVRLQAESLKEMKKETEPNYDAFESTLAQCEKGFSDKEFQFKMKLEVRPPKTFPALIEAAKQYVQDRSVRNTKPRV